MTEDEVRALPIGTRLAEFRGVKPGDVVNIYSYSGPDSIDQRIVYRLQRKPSETGVVVGLDKPIPDGEFGGDAIELDFAWTLPVGAR